MNDNFFVRNVAIGTVAAKSHTAGTFIERDKNKNMLYSLVQKTKKANVARQIGQRQWRRDDDVVSVYHRLSVNELCLRCMFNLLCFRQSAVRR